MPILSKLSTKLFPSPAEATETLAAAPSRREAAMAAAVAPIAHALAKCMAQKLSDGQVMEIKSRYVVELSTTLGLYDRSEGLEAILDGALRPLLPFFADNKKDALEAVSNRAITSVREAMTGYDVDASSCRVMETRSGYNAIVEMTVSWPAGTPSGPGQS